MSKTSTSRDAERCVLGAMLRLNVLIDEVSPILLADDFESLGHQLLYKTILHIREMGGVVDLVTLADTIQHQGQLEEVGGYTYIAELWEVAPTAGNAVAYAKIVKDRARKRRLALLAHRILDDIEQNRSSADELEEDLDRSLLELRERYSGQHILTASEKMSLAADVIDRACDPTRDADHIETGIDDLDRLVTGLHRGELAIVAARPSLGKTALALQIARNVADTGKQVLFVSLEQSAAIVGLRLIAQDTGISVPRLRSGRIDTYDQEKIAKAMSIIRRLPLQTLDPKGTTNMMHIASAARQAKRAAGLDLLIVDFLQFIEPNPGGLREPRYRELARISARLKSLGRELNVPVLAVASLNRLADERPDRRPRMGDLRESGALESDADVILLLSAADPAANPQEPTKVISLDVAKNRNGPCAEFFVVFHNEAMRFGPYIPGMT